MNIIIIGTGNTASVLGRKLKLAGHNIKQVFGRDSKAASQLAYELDTESTNYWNIVSRDAEMYIIAVADIAIEEILKELRLPHGTVVHTAASASKNILKETGEHYGVLYPLQTLRKGADYLPDMPIVIDASDADTLAELEVLAHTISNQVVQANDEQRMKLHVAAVFCNNFVNHLYALAEDFCKKEKLDFKLLLPLINETTERLKTMSPAQSQTGPALRNDGATIEKHLAELEKYPQLKKVYSVLSESIHQSGR